MAWLIGRTAIVPARNPDPKDSGGPSEGRCNPVSLGNVRSDEATMKYMTPMFGGPMRRGESFNAYKRRHARGGLRRNPEAWEEELARAKAADRARYRRSEDAEMARERAAYDANYEHSVRSAYDSLVSSANRNSSFSAELAAAEGIASRNLESRGLDPLIAKDRLAFMEEVLHVMGRSVDIGDRPGEESRDSARARSAASEFSATYAANKAAFDEKLRKEGLGHFIPKRGAAARDSRGYLVKDQIDLEEIRERYYAGRPGDFERDLAKYRGLRHKLLAGQKRGVSKGTFSRPSFKPGEQQLSPGYFEGISKYVGADSSVKVTPAAEKVVGPEVADALAQKVEEILPPGTKAVIKTDAKKVAKARKSGSKKPSRREMLDRLSSRAGLDKSFIRSMERVGLVFPKELKKFLRAKDFGPRNRVGGKVKNLPSYRKAYNAAVRAGVDPDLAKMFSSPEDLEDIAALTKMGTVQGATRASKRGKAKSSARKSVRGRAGSSRRRNPYSVDGASRVPSVRGGFSGSSAVPGSLRIRSNPMARYGAEDIRLMKKRKKSRKSRRNPAIGSVVKSMGDFVIHSGLPLVGGVVAIRSINEGANYLGSKIPGVSQFMPLVVGAGTLFGGFFLAQASDAGDLDRIPVINKIFGRRRSDDGFGMGRMEGRGDMIKVVAGVATLLGLVKAYSNVIPGLSSVAQYVGLNEIQYRPAMNGVGEFQYSTNGLNEVQYMPQLNGLNEVQYMPALNGLAGPAYTTDPNFMNSSYLPDHVAGINGLPNFMG